MTTNTTVASTGSRATRVRGPATIWRLGSAAAGIAAATNLAIFAVARAADAPFLVAFKTNQAKSPIAAAHVLFATVLALAAATAVAVLWVSPMHHGVVPVQVVAAVMAVLSVGMPLSLHADTGTKLALASMHLLAGTAFVLAMQRVRTPNSERSAATVPGLEQQRATASRGA